MQVNCPGCVVWWGRVYLQRILDTMRPLQQSSHKVQLTTEFLADILWWLACLRVFNGKAIIIPHRVERVVVTDACDQGAGLITDTDWAYIHFVSDAPFLQDSHINIKTLAVIAAGYRWCHMWRGQHITFFTDNVTTRAAVNQGACRHPLVIMAHLRFMFWLSVMFDFTLECCFVPGCFNIADTPSRLHEWGQFLYMYQLTSGGLPFCINNLSLLWCNNISHKSLSLLLDRHSYKYGTIPWCQDSLLQISVLCNQHKTVLPVIFKLIYEIL